MAFDWGMYEGGRSTRYDPSDDDSVMYDPSDFDEEVEEGEEE